MAPLHKATDAYNDSYNYAIWSRLTPLGPSIRLKPTARCAHAAAQAYARVAVCFVIIYPVGVPLYLLTKLFSAAQTNTLYAFQHGDKVEAYKRTKDVVPPLPPAASLSHTSNVHRAG